jgi:hypothetical protein
VIELQATQYLVNVNTKFLKYWQKGREIISPNSKERGLLYGSPLLLL